VKFKLIKVTEEDPDFISDVTNGRSYLETKLKRMTLTKVPEYEHSDREYIDYLEKKYRTESDSPTFNLREELDLLIRQEKQDASGNNSLRDTLFGRS
jgi:hypothetical protein